MGALQEQRPQHALKRLPVAAMILGWFSAGAGQFWAGLIAGIGIQPLFQRLRRAVLGRRNRRYRHSAVVPALVLPDTIPGAAQAKTAPTSNQPVNRRAPHRPTAPI